MEPGARIGQLLALESNAGHSPPIAPVDNYPEPRGVPAASTHFTLSPSEKNAKNEIPDGLRRKSPPEMIFIPMGGSQAHA